MKALTGEKGKKESWQPLTHKFNKGISTKVWVEGRTQRRERLSGILETWEKNQVLISRAYRRRREITR